MEKQDTTPMFYTGICEDASSKRTIISVINYLKKHLSEKIHVVAKNNIATYNFSQVINHNRCIFLIGFHIKGTSLYDLYCNYLPQSFFSDSTKGILEVILQVFDASEELKKESGFYPALLLNSIYLDKANLEVTFLPFKIITFINTYYEVEKQRVLYFCIGKGNKDQYTNQKALTYSLTKFIYLLLTKDQDVRGEPIFDISTFIPDTPRYFSDMVWNIMQEKAIDLKRFREVVQEGISQKEEGNKFKIPLFRQKSFILFKFRLTGLLSKRWKLIFLMLIILGVVAYIIYDIITRKEAIDYTKDLNPVQVVELYFKGINNLDMDIIDSVFYKRAGKEVKNELNRLYVMQKMKSVYEPEAMNSNDKSTDGYRIKNLEIEEIMDDENPVFSASYTKVIDVGNELKEYHIEETISLKKYNDHWFITKSERKIKY